MQSTYLGAGQRHAGHDARVEDVVQHEAGVLVHVEQLQAEAGGGVGDALVAVVAVVRVARHQRDQLLAAILVQVRQQRRHEVQHSAPAARHLAHRVLHEPRRLQAIVEVGALMPAKHERENEYAQQNEVSGADGAVPDFGQPVVGRWRTHRRRAKVVHFSKPGNFVARGRFFTTDQPCVHL